MSSQGCQTKYMFGECAAEFRKATSGQILACIRDATFTTCHLESLNKILRFENLCVHSVDYKSGNEEAEPSILEAAFSVQWVVSSLVKTLANGLITAENESTPRQRELQFRALFHTLILLYSQNVRAVASEFHNEFQALLRARFRDLEFLQDTGPNELTPAKFYKHQCFYLLAAISEYFAHFTSHRPKAVRVLGRTVSFLSFALLATGPALGGGFDLPRALAQLNNTIRSISRSFDARYSLHFTLYELTQISLGLYEYAVAAKALLPYRETAANAKSSAYEIATEIVRKVTFVIGSNDPANDIDEVSSPSSFWSGVSATMDRGPTRFDRYYYFYGVIDCVVQISRAMISPSMPNRLTENLEALEQKMSQIAIVHSAPTLRWKALEYLLYVQKDGLTVVEKLTSFARPEYHARIRAETEAVWGLLPPFQRRNSNEPTPGGRNLPMWAEEQSTVSYDLTTSSSLLPGRSQLDLKRLKPIVSAGISPNCKYVFFMGKEAVAVYTMGTVKEGQGRPILDPPKRKTRFVCSAISDRCIATISLSELHVYGLGPGGDRRTSLALAKTRHVPQSLIPHCMAICDVGDYRTYIVVAGRSTDERGVWVLRLSWEYSPPHMEEVTMNLDTSILTNKSIEFIELSRDCEWLCCSYSYTHRSSSAGFSRVLVWSLTTSSANPLPPFQRDYEFGTVAQAKGVTSAFPFSSPSKKPWMFCTTWPSYERAIHDGEWSFLSPLFAEPTTVPSHLIRHLTVLDERTPLVAGTVSSDGHVLAARGASGRIWLVRLLPDPLGGLKGSERVLLDDSVRFSKQDKIPSCSMRFLETPDGLDFFAVDFNGNVLEKHVLSTVN